MSELPVPEEALTEIATGKTTLRWYEFFADRDAYTPYIPTVTASVGTFTTVSATGRYKKKGRTVFINVVITITTVGTAAGTVLVTLPFTSAAFAQMLTGRDTTVGTADTGLVPASTAQIQVLRYDATTVAVAGRTIVVSGSYESAT